MGHANIEKMLGSNLLNLIPRAHVAFGQWQDTELWNNQLRRTSSFTAHACFGLKRGIQR